MGFEELSENKQELYCRAIGILDSSIIGYDYSFREKEEYRHLDKFIDDMRDIVEKLGVEYVMLRTNKLDRESPCGYSMHNSNENVMVIIGQGNYQDTCYEIEKIARKHNLNDIGVYRGYMDVYRLNDTRIVYMTNKGKEKLIADLQMTFNLGMYYSDMR